MTMFKNEINKPVYKDIYNIINQINILERKKKLKRIIKR